MGIFNGPASAIEDNRNKVNEINEQSTEIQYPSALASYKSQQQTKDYANNNFANVLKGGVSGAEVTMKDVSPITHNISVKLSNVDAKLYRSGKNKLDAHTLVFHNNDVAADFKAEGNSFTLRGLEGTSADHASSGQLTFPAISTNSTVYPVNIVTHGIPVIEGKTYTISFDYLLLEQGKWNNSVQFVVYYSDLSTPLVKNNQVLGEIGVVKHYSFVFNSTKTDKIGICFRINGNYVTISNIQVEEGSATEFEPYVEPTESVVNADGTANVPSLYPSTRLYTDTKGVTIEAEYNRDINKAFAELQAAIIYLGGI